MTTEPEQNRTDNRSPEDLRKIKKRNTLTLIGIGLVFLSPTLFALLWKPDGRVNFGELVQPPLPLVNVAVVDGASEFSNTSELVKKWRWITVVESACDQTCEATLGHLRQARLAEGKFSKRIRYTVLVLDPEGPEALKTAAQVLRKDHPVLEVLGVSGDDAGKIREQFETASGAKLLHQIFVIDPLGNIMMRYPAGTAGKPLKNDLSRLLRASHVG